VTENNDVFPVQKSGSSDASSAAALSGPPPQPTADHLYAQPLALLAIAPLPADTLLPGERKGAPRVVFLVLELTLLFTCLFGLVCATSFGCAHSCCALC
jgi:hypothetical protein